jgi:hypothetical protein
MELIAEQLTEPDDMAVELEVVADCVGVGCGIGCGKCKPW